MDTTTPFAQAEGGGQVDSFVGRGVQTRLATRTTRRRVQRVVADVPT
jgi:hypothetical protein